MVKKRIIAITLAIVFVCMLPVNASAMTLAEHFDVTTELRSGIFGQSNLTEAQIKADNATGLFKVNGTWKYYENGQFKEATGLVQRPDTGNWYYVKNGVYTKETTICKKVQNDGNWYFVYNGGWKKATGLAKRADNGRWYYIENGVYSRRTTLTKKIVKNGDNNWYYVQKGGYTKATGLAKRHDTGKWYYVRNGVYRNTATGLTQRIDTGKWYYVRKGAYTKYTGYVTYKSNRYYVRNGAVVGTTPPNELPVATTATTTSASSGTAAAATSVANAGNAEKTTEGMVDVEGSTLNVRTGPGTNYSRIGSLEDGAMISILSSTSGWYKIKFGSGTGYVHGDYVITGDELKKLQASISTEVTPNTIGNPFGTKKFYITSTALVWRMCPYHGKEIHSGWDLAIGRTGEPIYSVLGGKVAFSGSLPGYGSHVLIIQTGDLYVLYGHMSANMVSKGATVKKGQRIGSQGSEGNSTGPHLHLEFRKKELSGTATANKENVIPMLAKWAIDYKDHVSEFSKIIR